MSVRAGIKIEILTKNSADFYQLMGPWLANRRVIADLGHVPFDDENKTWIVAIYEARVVGFVAAVQKTNHIEYCSAFVAPSSRGMGIYSELFFKRESLFRGHRIRAMVTSCSLPMHLRNGFHVVKKLKRYTEVWRVPIQNGKLDFDKQSTANLKNCEDHYEKTIS